MPPIPRRRKRPVLQWTRRLFLVLGLALLGYVGYSLLDARTFQLYENWRFSRAIENSPAAPSGVAKLLPVSSAPVAPKAAVARGSVLGRLEISRIGISVIIAEGTDGRTLRRAAGHIPGTALPGEQGNIAISGHRDTFFRPLRNIRPDDEITLATLNGSYSYRVDTIQVVEPDHMEVLDSTTESVLTLVTCYPFYFVGPAPQRFIVRAHRI